MAGAGCGLPKTLSSLRIIEDLEFLHSQIF